jgi:hypothetical protein
MGELITIDRDELRDMRIDLRRAGELIEEAEPSTDMENDRCEAWLDAANEWLENYAKCYQASDAGEQK